VDWNVALVEKMVDVPSFGAALLHEIEAVVVA